MSAPKITPKVFRQFLRNNFVAFLVKAWPHVCAGRPLKLNWHFLAMAYELDRIVKGKSRRLLINLPPRNGKTLTVTVIWIAYMLGIDPTLRFVCVSYSNDLSAKFGRDCRSIMQSEWYRELFPGTVISRSRSAAHDFETTRGGGRLATSTQGTLTGRGGDIIVLDDLIKPDEVHSTVARENLNEWYKSTLLSRLDDKVTGAQIFVTQRLHQYDLSGLILETGQWDHLSLPAVAPEEARIPLLGGRIHHRKVGDVLHPDHEPMATLEELKAGMGTDAFAAQYLQDPVPAEGLVVKREWLKFYAPSDLDRDYGYLVQSWDTAGKDNPHNDYSVGLTALVQRKLIYILDVVRAKYIFPELESRVIALNREHGGCALLIEDAASGQALLQRLWAESPQGVAVPLRRKPEGDKLSRLMGVSSMIEGGRLHLPANAAWLSDFMSELLGFPSSRFDDQVDALAQMLIWLQEKDMMPTPRNVGPIEMDLNDYDDQVDQDPWSADFAI